MIVEVLDLPPPQRAREEDALREMGEGEQKAAGAGRAMTAREAKRPEIPARAGEKCLEMSTCERQSRLSQDVECPGGFIPVGIAFGLVRAGRTDAERIDMAPELAKRLDLAADEGVTPPDIGW